MADQPDLSTTLPDPTPLRRTAIIHFVWGSQEFDVVCTACSICQALDSHSGKEIAWLQCKGFQGGAVNPIGNVATQRYLVPAHYVTNIAYGGRFRIVEQKKSEDLGVFPPIHPSPATALSLDKIRELIASLQVQETPQSPLLYDNYVREVSNKFEQALALIKTEHSFEYGDEFEVAICKTLRQVLPQQYGICRGYVVSALGEKAGDDIIVFDRMRFPTLRALDTDDYARKEQVPIEAVYAYIEAKHSIWIKGDGGSSFQKALNQVAQVKLLCDRRPSVMLRSDHNVGQLGGWPEIRNPAYGIILSRYVRLNNGGPILDDPDVILRHLLDARNRTLLAPDFCVLGKSNMLIPVLPVKGTDGTAMPSPFFQSGSSSLNTVLVDGVGFGAGLSLLLWALDWIQLGEMPWPAILEDCIPPLANPL